MGRAGGGRGLGHVDCVYEGPPLLHPYSPGLCMAFVRYGIFFPLVHVIFLEMAPGLDLNQRRALTMSTLIRTPISGQFVA